MMEKDTALRMAEAEVRQRDRIDGLRTEFQLGMAHIKQHVSTQLKASGDNAAVSKYANLPSTKELEALQTKLEPHSIVKYLSVVEGALTRYSEIELLF